jgi:hypothetical protein
VRPIGIDVNRWNGSVTVRLAAFPKDARTSPLRQDVDGLLDQVELEVDRAGRVTALCWQDERDAPEVVRPRIRADAASGSVDLWIVDDGEHGAVARAHGDPGNEIIVHVGGDGRLVGLGFPQAETQLPQRLLREIHSDASEEPAAPDLEPPPPGGTGVFTVDARVATDEVGEETFTFHAGLLSWKTFVAELQEYAAGRELALRFEHRRGPLWGLLGVEITCVAEGRFSEVTDFAQYSRTRIRAWRDGDVAG